MYKCFFPDRQSDMFCKTAWKWKPGFLAAFVFIYGISWGRNSSMAGVSTICLPLSLKWDLVAYLHCHSEICPSGCLSTAGPWHYPWWRAALHSRHTSFRQHDKTTRRGTSWTLGLKVRQWAGFIHPPQPEMRSDGSGSWETSVGRSCIATSSLPCALTLKAIKVARIYARSSVWTSHIGARLAGRDGKTEFSAFSTPTCLNPTCPYRSQPLPTGLPSRPTANHFKAE